jgi:hypothetical protein
VKKYLLMMGVNNILRKSLKGFSEEKMSSAGKKVNCPKRKVKSSQNIFLGSIGSRCNFNPVSKNITV